MNPSNQAIFNNSPIVSVDANLIERLKLLADSSPTGRFRFCLHQSESDAVQEMIVVHRRGNYSRPHRHPPHLASTLVVLEGALGMYLFDDSGIIEKTIELDGSGGERPFALRIAGGIWHMPVCRTATVVFIETMAGPFVRDQANCWASWSPPEEDIHTVREFLAPFLAMSTDDLASDCKE